MRDVTGKGCNLPEASTREDLPLHDLMMIHYLIIIVKCVIATFTAETQCSA